jgi:hypothetical protein
MLVSNNVVKVLERHPTAPAFHWVVIETELRAWVENPTFGILPNEPVYLLCEILNANAQSKRAEIRPIDSACGYWIDYSQIHCIHTYNLTHNRVEKIHGEPKGI